MDLTKAAVSKFPRQGETPSVSLMTAFTGWSGQSEALEYGPGTISGWRPCMFSRLMCHSYTDWLTRRTVSGSSDSIGSIPVDSNEFDPDYGSLSMLGAFPLLVDNSNLFRSNHAPDAPESIISWSTTTSVDSAGWTEVVIQEGHHVFSYVSIGLMATVNASINYVLEAAPLQGGLLVKTDGVPSDNSTCGCPGPSDLSDIRFSCLSFNEVTK